jgi:AcrR family transcriptional regulator
MRPNLLVDERLPAEPRQKRSREKREHLKSAALALFAENGYEGTSIGDIARRAKLAVGGFYQHFESKRQLLLVLMDELLEKLTEVNLQPKSAGDAQTILRELLAAAFSRDLHYLGAYRAWQEAMLADPDLAKKQAAINAWTTGRIAALFQFLHQQPGARPRVNVAALARVMDSFFWSLLARAAIMQAAELNEWLDVSANLIYHALFVDASKKSKTKRAEALR